MPEREGPAELAIDSTIDDGRERLERWLLFDESVVGGTTRPREPRGRRN
jgi:hypothetical protein